jgi:uncharacterized membrane protein
MGSGRLEALTDGVVAIILTIVVLELRVPAGGDLASLAASAPLLLAYLLSFVNVGLVWNNHHHLLHATDRIDGRVLWANLFLLFWLSLVPFVIRWLDASGFGAAPVAGYGAVMGGVAVGYNLTKRAIILRNGPESTVARAVGSDWKGRSSIAGYAVAVPLAFVDRWVAAGLYVALVAIWFVPDRRLARLIED